MKYQFTPGSIKKLNKELENAEAILIKNLGERSATVVISENSVATKAASVSDITAMSRAMRIISKYITQANYTNYKLELAWKKETELPSLLDWSPIKKQ